MPFIKPLPGWESPGVEPDKAKKAEGWEADEHPPAAIFDWFFYAVSQALKEFQEGALHVDRLGKTVATLVNGKVPADQLDVKAPADASTTAKGIVKLNSATNSVDETTAATPKAVKAVMDEVAKKYTKTTGGIPKADLEATVQTSLDKADNAYKKPVGGIPLTDLESDPTKAQNISVIDTADYYAGANVEAILAEIGQNLIGTRNSMGTNVQGALSQL